MIEPNSTIFTIGHSTHSAEAFIALLKTYRIESLVDVRSFPASRRHPQFNKESLARALADSRIAYYHMVSLGGRRKRQDVPEHDTNWRNPAFANYADYAGTPPFRAGLAELEALARNSRAAIMCAEALWWRCHRRIIADELVKDGFPVTHILPPPHAAEAARSPELPGL